MHRIAPLWAIVFPVIALSLSACQTLNDMGFTPDQRQQISNDDFVGPARNAGPASSSEPADPAKADPTDVQSAAHDDSSNGPAEPLASDEPTSRVYAMDAMVGQINGRPIYAQQVFDAIGEQQLAQLGATLAAAEFRREVAQRLTLYLQQVVAERLLLAEAEQTLDEDQRQGLSRFVKQQLSELYSEHRGSREMAEQYLLKTQGITVAEWTRNKRQELLIRNYMRQLIYPRVQVRRDEVERYYQREYDRFNPPPKLIIRLLIVNSADKLDEVERGLNSGEPFKAVAERLADHRAEDGGMLIEHTLMPGDESMQITNWPELDEKIAQLDAGQWTTATDTGRGYVWAYLEALNRPQSRTLEDVYVELESELMELRYRQHYRAHVEQLQADGNFTPIPQMLERLMAVAISRFETGA